MISRVELIRKDIEKFRSARKIPPSGKRPLAIELFSGKVAIATGHAVKTLEMYCH